MFINNVNKINDYVSLGGQRVIIDLNELSRIEHNCKSPDEINNRVQSYPTDAFVRGWTDVRNQVYRNYNNRPTLGNLLNDAKIMAQNNQEVFFCRERAILAHVILASIGIPSIIVSGSNNNDRHSFVIYWHKKVAKVLDPQQRYNTTSKNPYNYGDYVNNLSIQVLVMPNDIIEGYSLL